MGEYYCILKMGRTDTYRACDSAIGAPELKIYRMLEMRKILFTLFVIGACCACDNPEDYTHPKTGSSGTTGSAATGSSTASTSASQSTTSSSNTGSSAAVSGPVGRDDSPTKTADIAASKFETVTIDGGGEVEINVGKPYHVAVLCNEKSMPMLKVVEKGTSLNITTDRNFKAAVAKVTVDTPKLNEIYANGTMLVKVNGVTGAHLSITGNGSSTVEANGTIDSLMAN